MKLKTPAVLSIIAVALLTIVIMWFNSGATFSEAFEKGYLSQSVVKKIVFESYRGEVVLSDPQSIDYLCKAKRYAPMPRSLKLVGGHTCRVSIHGSWLRNTVCEMFIGDDGSVIRISSYRALFNEPAFSYLHIDENAPSLLKTFLFSLSQSNR